jgi:AraC-like DNA-binding protein
MPRSVTREFTDPLAYEAATRTASSKFLVTAKGRFRVALTQIDLDRLGMLYGHEDLPRLSYFEQSRELASVMFLAEKQPKAQCNGLDIGPGEILVVPAGASYHARILAPCRWRVMSLPLHDLSAAIHAVFGHHQNIPSAANVVRPDSSNFARLTRLHDETRRLALTAPEIFAHPVVSRTLEQALVHAMITCLAAHSPTNADKRWRHHSAIIRRFEDLLAANSDRPMHLPEICAAVGACERTLRACCEEHLGMSPTRYLWLRRMHLVQRALLLCDPASTTVTQTATGYGFWELGRFAVSYRQLFGESPSATLNRSPGVHRAFRARSNLLDCETIDAGALTGEPLNHCSDVARRSPLRRSTNGADYRH